MKTILITGTEGFIGKNLLKTIKEQGEEIILEINEDIFKTKNWKTELKLFLLENTPDVIYHVGACSNTMETDVNYMMKLNYEFTKVLTDWTKKNGGQLIFSSSAANYGTVGEYPSNLYGWSKYVSEQYVISNGGIALRYFNVYGVGEKHKNNMASIALQFYLKHIRGEECKLFPNKPSRDFIYIKDVVSANLFASSNYDKLKRNWYDVGTGESRTFEDVLTLLKIPFTYHAESEIPEGYQFFTCSDKKKWMPGWEPKYILDEGLNEYKKYLRTLK